MIDGLRICSVCMIEKPYSEYYRRENGKPLGRKCKGCVRALDRQRSMVPDVREKRIQRQKQYQIDNPEKGKINSIKYYESVKGRASTLMKGVRDRCSKYSEVLDFDESFIEERLIHGKCAITDLTFDLSTKGDSKKNPFSPSIDRIDCNVGYIKSNVRIILWQVNLMKGELPDCQLLQMCKEVIKNERNLCMGH